MTGRFKKWAYFSLVFLLLFVFLVACGTDGASRDGDQATGEEVENSVNEEGVGEAESAFPITITDSAGQEVTIEKEPESIVSIQASNTEILFALGAGDKVIGVSDYCNYPEEVLDIQKVGGQDMDAELILTLLPDLVFVTDYHFNNHAEILKQFEEAGIAVVVTGSAESFEDVYGTIEMIAAATGSTEKAQEVISGMKESLVKIEEKASAVTDKKRVWVEVSPAPDIFTTGKGTFMNEMLESIQAINVAGEQEGWVKLTEEEIVQFNPDVIITTYGYYVDEPSAEVLKRDGWAEVPAIKNKQVFDVDNDTVNRPGPRLIEGVETLAKFIYPEIFTE